MYAVIETGGKQYQVKEGDILFIEKLEAEGEITFDKVIMVGKDDGVTVGAPYVDGASVKATDLRAGACLVIAALAAEGITTISNIEYIDRGYENLVEKLRSLGADIRRG